MDENAVSASRREDLEAIERALDNIDIRNAPVEELL